MPQICPEKDSIASDFNCCCGTDWSGTKGQVQGQTIEKHRAFADTLSIATQVSEFKQRFTRDKVEYSIAKDAAFYLCCYLFKSDIGEQAGGDTFVSEGFSNWKCPKKLKIHEGGINSSHRQASRMCDDLLKPNQSIQSFHFKQTDQARIEYQTRLNASINCIQFLLRQELAFRGHDESEDSSNQGNFLELLRFLADHNEDIKAVTLRNAPENNMLISPAIQKDIEQMVVALRYVDKKGHVVERFLGIEHVTDTSALSLKVAVEDLFCRHGLSLSRLRGQGYDGASNMQDPPLVGDNIDSVNLTYLLRKKVGFAELASVSPIGGSESEEPKQSDSGIQAMVWQTYQPGVQYCYAYDVPDNHHDSCIIM
uniref:TTF-type domain-containing protein n=1 Tax=Fagus sylvatica TaxID=28930 RepID=A0A2N9I761_FAGSY